MEGIYLINIRIKNSLKINGIENNFKIDISEII